MKDICSCVHALDGFETYKVDESTIGIRPIWFDAIKNPPPAMKDVLLVYEGRVITGWNESTQSEEDPSYCSCEINDCFIGTEGVTHWMPIPKPPEDK